MVGGVQPLRAAEETFHMNVNNLATGLQYLSDDLKSEYLKRETAINVLE